LNPNIPAGVGSTIMKALSKSPFLRYENCRELMDDLKNYRPGESPTKENTAPSMSPLAPRPAIRERVDKSYHAEMPRIPGVEPRSTVPIPARSKPIPPPSAPAADVLRETGQPGEGIYGGRRPSPISLRRSSASQKSARLSCWRQCSAHGPSKSSCARGSPSPT